MNRYTNESLRTPHRNFSLFTRLFVSFTVLIAFQCAYAQQADQEVLDNAAVVKLVQAHLGTDLIIEQIRNSPSNFTLTTASLIKLKQQGVPDKVIAAMQAAKGASAKSPAGAGSASAASVSTRMVEANRPDQIAGVPSWQLKTVKDAMTDKVSSELELQAVGDPVGRQGRPPRAELEILVGASNLEA